MDETELTRGLGEEFVVSTAVLKRYPCHATAHAAVKAVRDLQAEHGFTGVEIEAITVTGTARMVERHNILEPADLMLAQYSIPFSVALALCREARDPESWDESALADPQIRALCRRVKLVPGPAWRARRDGEHGDDNAGRWAAPRAARPRAACSNPASWATNSLRLTRAALGEHPARALFERLQRLEEEKSLDWLT